MNEKMLVKSLDNMCLQTSVKKTVWIDGTPNELEIRYSDPADEKMGYYYVFLMGDSSYIISTNNFQRIQEAIIEGAKFVRINDDLVNINQIKRFKKNQ